MGPHLISGFAALSRGTWWPGQPLGGESSGISTAATRPPETGSGSSTSMTPTLAPQTSPSFMCSPGSQRDQGLLALLSHPRDPGGRTVLKDSKTSRYSGFTHPKILGKARIMGGSQNPKAPTPRGPGSNGGSIPSRPGVVLCTDLGGATTPDPPISSGFWPRVNKAATLTAGPGGPAAPVSPSLPGRPYGGEKTLLSSRRDAADPTPPSRPPCLSFPTQSLQVPQGFVLLEQPQDVFFFWGGGGSEGGKTTHPQPWGTREAFLTGFSRLTLERGERRW